MKRTIALLLALVFVLALAACGEKTETPTTEPTTTTEPATTETTEPATTETTEPAATEPEVTEPTGPVVADPEPIPEPFQHLTFDGEDEGIVYKALQDGAIVETGVELAYSDGAVGKALYLDGKQGADLGLQPTNTDAYTIAFWTYASRLSTFGPTLQLGYDIGANDTDPANNVTWMNITQTEWGADNAKIFPVVWSRNQASGSWPWMYSWDDAIHGKKEWVHVAVVALGENYVGAGGTEETGAQLYINGALVYDSWDNFNNSTYFEMSWDATLAPAIMQPGDKTFESYFGVNYWDTMYKGWVDDLYTFDSALTAGQIATLYQMGDPTVEPVAPEMGEAAAEEPEPTPVPVTITGTQVGAITLDSGFWTAFSDIWAVPAGETVTKTFVNYNDLGANWHNFVVVLQTTAEGHSADTAGYAEYAVVRADNFGWGGGYDGIATAECDWNWDTFMKDMDGATVVLNVTNNGATADITFTATALDGTVHNQSYKGIAVTGDLYFTLGVECACLDIIG